MKEERRYLNNIRNFVSVFKKTGHLKPEEMLDLIESKKFIIENKKGDLDYTEWLAKIEKVEKEYYKDLIPPIPEGLRRLLDKEPITIEAARESLAKFIDVMKKHPEAELHIKLHLRYLDRRMIKYTI